MYLLGWDCPRRGDSVLLSQMGPRQGGSSWSWASKVTGDKGSGRTQCSICFYRRKTPSWRTVEGVPVLQNIRQVGGRVGCHSMRRTRNCTSCILSRALRSGDCCIHSKAESMFQGQCMGWASCPSHGSHWEDLGS